MLGMPWRAELVEAPGTAPGSAALIPHGVYRHSRLPDDINIGLRRANRKGQEEAAIGVCSLLMAGNRG
jgi:hypothetical protein